MFGRQRHKQFELGCLVDLVGRQTIALYNLRVQQRPTTPFARYSHVSWALERGYASFIFFHFVSILAIVITSVETLSCLSLKNLTSVGPHFPLIAWHYYETKQEKLINNNKIGKEDVSIPLLFFAILKD